MRTRQAVRAATPACPSACSASGRVGAEAGEHLMTGAVPGRPPQVDEVAVVLATLEPPPDRLGVTARMDGARMPGPGRPRDQGLAAASDRVGLRASEGTNATIEAVGTDRGHRTLVITREGGKVVTIPLAPQAAPEIDLASQRQSGPRQPGPARHLSRRCTCRGGRAVESSSARIAPPGRSPPAEACYYSRSPEQVRRDISGGRGMARARGDNMIFVHCCGE